MTLSTFDALSALTAHSAGFADAARGDLTAPVEHCPGWSVADLVWHLTEVHWFWATIAEGPLDAPPPQEGRPARPDDAALLETFTAGAGRLARVLREADQAAPAWTWAPWQSDVAFITRHQVQEAAVHHFDAAHAAGLGWTCDPTVASDAVDEFLHFSVASEDDEDDPPAGALDGPLAFRATDTGDTWTLTDSDRPGACHVERGVADGPVVEGPAADLLLWLYARTDLETADVPDDLVARFRAHCFTD
jgi:uncharacterized protein (TIGR03083 family)